MIYDFDVEIDRRGTDAVKYEELPIKYGRSDLMPMWIADMDFAVPPCITEAIAARTAHPVLGYTHPSDAFWGAITGWLGRRHGWSVGRDQIDYVPGVKKGLALCVCHFTRPGDKVVIQPPVYHSFRSVVEGTGRHAVDNPLIAGADGDYRMDFDGLERIIAEQSPRMLILCNPHNPIGRQWDAPTLQRLAATCRRAGMILLSDEIYGDMCLPGAPRHIPTATVSPDAAEITVTLGAPSKTFNIPGLASAWTVIPNAELRRGFFDFLLAGEFDTPPLYAQVATRAAYEGGAEWLDQALAYIAANARHVADRLERELPAARAVMPEAGFGMWIQLGECAGSHDAMIQRLIERGRIALSDGVSFGPGGEGFVRLNIGTARATLDRGLDHIIDALRQ